MKNNKSFEDRLVLYKNRMEFLRTIIGLVVLTIQLVILHNLLTK
jgi:hypothetical protein